MTTLSSLEVLYFFTLPLHWRIILVLEREDYMGIIKRSIVSITQRLWKSLILLLVVFSLGNVIAAAVTVRDSTENVEKSMKERLGSYVSVDIDEGYLSTPDPDVKEFRFFKDDADKIGDDPRVRDYTYSIMNSMGHDNLEKYESKTGTQMNSFGAGDTKYYDFTLIGNKNGTPNDALNEKIKISEGRFPNDEDNSNNPYVLAISEEVAELNNLKVGDKVPMTFAIPDMGEPDNGVMMMGEMKLLDQFDQEFEIVGIFKTTDKEPANQMEQMMQEFAKNNMYTTINASAELDMKSAKAQADHYEVSVEEYLRSVTPTYILNSVDDLEGFVADNKGVLPKAYKFNSSQDSFESVASSITNMNNLANNVYYFGIAISIIILSLIIILFLRERKTEFGIYQALGESRIKTMMQIGLEVIIISVVGVSLALFSGNIIAEKVSTQMIETQLLADENQAQGNGMGMVVSIGGNDINMPKISAEEVMESYQVEMTSEYVISFYAVMLGSATIATLASMIYILRLKPREILL